MCVGGGGGGGGCLSLTKLYTVFWGVCSCGLLYSVCVLFITFHSELKQVHCKRTGGCLTQGMSSQLQSGFIQVVAHLHLRWLHPLSGQGSSKT